MNFQQLLDQGRIRPPFLTLVNCRPDRIERNAQMGEIVPELLTETLVLIGHPTKLARDAVPRDWRGRLVDLGGANRGPDEIWEHIIAQVPGEATLVAVGNIHGQGERLLEHMARLRRPAGVPV